MKIETKMIDKQLRLPALFFDMIMKPPSIKKFKALHKKIVWISRKKHKGINYKEVFINRHKDDSPLRVCIYSPLVLTKNAPGILWIHGGGYAMGTPELSSKMISKFIKQSGCVVVAPDYRLSLDSPYPAALEDCHDALLWMKNKANELNINENQLIVGGESAGGGLTVALSMYERDNNGVKIAFQIPLYPMLDDQMINESAKDNNAPIWDTRTNQLAWDLYLGKLKSDEVPYYAVPARAINYSNLPPAITFVGDLEPFKDETIKYINELKKVDIPVFFEVFEGCYHGFDRINPFARVSKQANSFLLKSFEYALNHFFAEQCE
jgi:acetyl esterase/lipase